MTHQADELRYLPTMSVRRSKVSCWPTCLEKFLLSKIQECVYIALDSEASKQGRWKGDNGVETKFVALYADISGSPEGIYEFTFTSLV